MPKSKGVPSYRFHKARNCAVVTIEGRNIYLGVFGSAESKARYAEKIAEWQRTKSATPHAAVPATIYTVGKLAVEYLRFAEGYYVKNGETTAHVESCRSALKALVALYEDLPVQEFGPVKLRNVQQHLVERDYCRKYVNQLIGCIVRAFRWAAGEEKLSASIPEALRYVRSLKRGRTAARESAPILPVDDATVNETVKHVSPIVAAMIELQRLSGMRPGEVCSVRPCDVTFSLDGTGCYRPESHKSEHQGRERRIYLGPQALTILKQFIERDPEACCFSPRESAAWHRDQHRQQRQTPLHRAHLAHYDRKRKSKPRRAPGERFNVCSYNRAIQRGCEVAFGMPTELRTISRKVSEDERAELKRQAREWRAQNCWSANQLRHNAATRLRKEFGIETAQVVLGHSNPQTTLIYAERDFAAAASVMKQFG
jgi:integrase